MEILKQKNDNLIERIKHVNMATNGNCGPGACGNQCKN